MKKAPPSLVKCLEIDIKIPVPLGIWAWGSWQGVAVALCFLTMNFCMWVAQDVTIEMCTESIF